MESASVRDSESMRGSAGERQRATTRERETKAANENIRGSRRAKERASGVVVGGGKVGACWEVGGGGSGRGRERRGPGEWAGEEGGEGVCSGGGCGLSPHVDARTIEPVSTRGLIYFVARTLTPERKIAIRATSAHVRSYLSQHNYWYPARPASIHALEAREI